MSDIDSLSTSLSSASYARLIAGAKVGQSPNKPAGGAGGGPAVKPSPAAAAKAGLQLTQAAMMKDVERVLTILGVPKDKITQLVQNFSKLLDAKPPQPATKPDKQAAGDALAQDGKADDRAAAIGDGHEVPRNSFIDLSSPPPNTQGLNLTLDGNGPMPWAFGEKPGQNLMALPGFRGVFARRSGAAIGLRRVRGLAIASALFS